MFVQHPWQDGTAIVILLTRRGEMRRDRDRSGDDYRLGATSGVLLFGLPATAGGIIEIDSHAGGWRNGLIWQVSLAVSAVCVSASTR